MALTSETIEGFVRTLLLKSFDNAVEIPDCHREWWKMCCSPSKFVAIAAPRAHAKSTAITHSYTLAKLLFREAVFVLIVSDTETQSALFLNDIKKELLENQDLRDFFGVEGLTKETETDIIVKFSDGHQARVIAKGSEQKLRGLKWQNKRPDLIICDDMENDELVLNKDRRDKLKRWFSSALLPVRSSTGIIRVVGTILHADSLLESFMPQEHDKETVQDSLRTYSKRTRAWTAIKYRAHDRKMQLFLWPEKYTKTELSAIREMYVAQGLGDVYSQEYLNQPIDESNTYFRRSDFGTLRQEEKEKRLVFYITADLAVSEKQRTDFSAFIVSGVDEEGVVQVRHVIKERMDSLEICDTFINLAREYDPYLVVCEKGTIVNSILPVLKQKMVEEGVFFIIELIAPTVDKVQRAQAIRARARSGRVKVDKEADWWPDLEDELLKFPRAVHDDQVDALSLIGLAINKFHEAPTKEEIQEEQEEEERYIGGFFDLGRNLITGY